MYLLVSHLCRKAELLNGADPSLAVRQPGFKSCLTLSWCGVFDLLLNLSLGLHLLIYKIKNNSLKIVPGT